MEIRDEQIKDWNEKNVRKNGGNQKKIKNRCECWIYIQKCWHWIL